MPESCGGAADAAPSAGRPARAETLADWGLELPDWSEDWWCTHPSPAGPDSRHESPDTAQDATSPTPRSAASSVGQRDKGNEHHEAQCPQPPVPVEPEPPRSRDDAGARARGEPETQNVFSAHSSSSAPAPVHDSQPVAPPRPEPTLLELLSTADTIDVESLTLTQRKQIIHSAPGLLAMLESKRELSATQPSAARTQKPTDSGRSFSKKMNTLIQQATHDLYFRPERPAAASSPPESREIEHSSDEVQWSSS